MVTIGGFVFVAALAVLGWGTVKAAWLLRAIAMENIAVRAEEAILELPAGPRYRLHKEVKMPERV